MSEETKSEVELFWDKVRVHFNDPRGWHELHPVEQHRVIGGINAILGVLR